MVDSARRLAELRQGREEPIPPENADGLEFEPEETNAAFSILSADRMHKLMVEFRLLGGNAKGLAYSYMVAADFDPSEGIKLDFSGYAVQITGRNLRPLFDGLARTARGGRPRNGRAPGRGQPRGQGDRRDRHQGDKS